MRSTEGIIFFSYEGYMKYVQEVTRPKKKRGRASANYKKNTADIIIKNQFDSSYGERSRNKKNRTEINFADE